MTDGQTFYLILIGLYLIISLKTGSKGAFVLQKKFSLNKGWSLGHPFAFLGGAQKSLFVTHFSPLYSYSIIVNFDKKTGSKILPGRHTKRIIHIIANAASKLRFFTFTVFYLYFIIIPVVYFKHGDKPFTYLVILIAMIFPAIPAFYFFRIHKKLSPQERSIRWKNSCYAILMPWHAMRLSDLLFHNPHFSKIHPLSYANISSGEASRTYLAQQYRNSIHLPKSLYTKQEFDEFFKISEESPENFTAPPQTEDSTEKKYCPCCHSLFTEQTNLCEECGDLPLIDAT